MPARKLKNFLDENNIEYVTISHSPAFTAQGIAHSAHVSGKEMAKTVILNKDGTLVMAVLPANQKVDTQIFKHAVGADKVDVAKESDFKETFPGCELGAMPPFGNLWDVPVYVAEELRDHDSITFNAGSHVELVQMRYKDFEKLVKPEIVKLTCAMV
jgi:Ala-tRNA(Pro) deacylase